MPNGPKGEKRPADVIGNAAIAMPLATGEEAEETKEAAPGPSAAGMGRQGGGARARNPVPEQRREIAKEGAASRWSDPE